LEVGGDGDGGAGAFDAVEVEVGPCGICREAGGLGGFEGLKPVGGEAFEVGGVAAVDDEEDVVVSIV
jgi:hypothetical protein